MKKNQVLFTLVAVSLLLFMATIGDVSAIVKHSVKINDGNAETTDRQVELDLTAPSGTRDMRIANSLSDLGSASWQPFRDDKKWTLPGRNEKVTVYVQFRDRNGALSRVYRDSIKLTIAERVGVKINNGDARTEERRVEVYITPPKNAKRMRISDSRDFSNVRWGRVRRDVKWTLPEVNGRKHVYVQFQYNDQRLSNIYTDNIVLSEPPEPIAQFTINGDVGETESREVKLSFRGVRVYDEIRISNTKDFVNAEWQPMTRVTVPWLLSGKKGTNAVYVEFRTEDGKLSEVERETIKYAPKTADSVEGGGLVRAPDNKYYFLGADEALHPFSHTGVLLSYYQDPSDARVITQEEFSSRAMGQPVCVRAGTWLVKFEGFARVYAVEPGCVLRPIRSEAEAYMLYGRGWQYRILHLPGSASRVYDIDNLALPSRHNDVDGDGVSSADEKAAGSSDTEEDTDGDRLSDYEEINFWGTDPAVVDSDGDGMPDGAEVIAGRQPNGSGTITSAPAESYVYPVGAFVYDWWDKKYYHYQANDDLLYKISQNSSSRRFQSNRFQRQFAVHPPHALDLKRSTKSISSNDVIIRDPSKKISRSVVPL